MRLWILSTLVLGSVVLACGQQSREQVRVDSDKRDGGPAKSLLLEVLETDSGVSGTHQFVYIRIFRDGLVEYHPKRSQELKKERVTQAHISEEDLASTAKMLAREDVTALPSTFESTFVPIDFYWTLDFAIPRATQSQRIKVVNFSTAMAVRNNKTYPEALVRLVCAAWTVRTRFSTETPNISGDCRGFVGQK